MTCITAWPLVSSVQFRLVMSLWTGL